MAVNTNRLIACLGLAIFSIAAIPLGLWGLSLEFATHNEAIHSGRQLVVISDSHGYLPGALVGILGIAALSVLTLLFGFRKKPNKRLLAAVQMVAGSLLLAGVLIVFIGHFAVTSYWEHKAKQANYERCPPMTLLLDRMTYTAWVQDVALCHDRDVSRIVLRGHPGESTIVEARLEARKKQKEARAQYLEKNQQRATEYK